MDVYTLAESDTLNVAPSATLDIDVFGGDPTAPASPGDTLNFTTPVGETATLILTGTDSGVIQTSGGYLDVDFDEIETVGFSGNLAISGTGLDDVLEVTATAADSGSFVLTSGGVTGPTVNFSGLSSLTFNAGDGNDELIINHAAGSLFAPSGGIHYLGQGAAGDSDVLTLNDGSATTVTHTFTNDGGPNDNQGTVDWDGTTLTYSGLEPIEDNMSAANRVFDFPDSGNNITLTDDTSTAGRSRITSNASETVDFVNPSSTLTINAGAGSDSVNLQDPDSGCGATIRVNGEGSTDTLNIDLSGTFTSVTHHFANQTDGRVELAGGSVTTITYTGLEKINDNLAATDRVMNYGTAADDANLNGGTAAGDNISRIQSPYSNVLLDFVNPTAELVVRSNAGSLGDLRATAIDIGAWQRIATAGIDARSVESVQGEGLLFYHQGELPATPEFGTASHMWRQGAPSGPFGDGAAVEIKWWDVPSTDETYHNGRPVTVESADYPDIEGPAYLKYVGYQRFQFWQSYDGTPGTYPSDGTFSSPVTTSASGDANGYLGSGMFTLYEGHGLPSPGSDDAVGRATYTWDGATLTLGSPTNPTGLEYSYTVQEQAPAHKSPISNTRGKQTAHTDREPVTRTSVRLCTPGSAPLDLGTQTLPSSTAVGKV
jgi:hypothetical protein